MQRENNPLLPGFPCRFGRPRISRLARAKEQAAEKSYRQLTDLQDLFSPWIDSSLLMPAEARANSRNRLFSMEILFWAFLCQVLSGMGCRGAVKTVQSWMIHRGRPAPSSKPSAYCQARNRLPLGVLQKIFSDMSSRLSKRVPISSLWHGRHVKVVDGTGLSAADTESNQGQWPQNRNVKPGCGFPELKLAGLFCLHSGALLGWAEGNKHDHETTLWSRLWDMLQPGDIVLGDRAFGSYASIAALIQRGIEGVYRLHGNRKMDWTKGRALGPKDRLRVWRRPRTRGKNWTAEKWAELPVEMEVRIVERSIDVRGFRPTKITLVTTLTDAGQFPADDLIGLYRRRWDVELFFRDVKITLGMDVLRCQSPPAVRKELAMYLICYNLLRGMMQKAARQEGVPVERISFQGVVEQLSHWLWLFMGNQSHADRRRKLREFYLALVTAPLPKRPDRTEPRVRKRRPKNYRLMTRPRNADKLGKTA